MTWIAPSAPLTVPLCLWQIHFPALDIRLSYNDIQLFLAIAKSLPGAGMQHAASQSDTSHSLSTASSQSRREDLGQKTEAFTGRWSPTTRSSLFFCRHIEINGKPHFVHGIYFEWTWIGTADIKQMQMKLFSKKYCGLKVVFLFPKRNSLTIYKTLDLKKWTVREPYSTAMVRNI